jgi:purine-binding chemotaxis protein CheW
MTADNSAQKKSIKGKVSKDSGVQFILIGIGNSFYAIDIMKIVEIVKYIPVTKVPKAPEFLEGIIDLRGTLIPVLDMRKRFDIQAEKANEKPNEKVRIVVIKVLDKIAGLIVDEVKEVLKVASHKVMPAPKIVQGIESEYLSSVVSDKGRIILVLDLDRILTTTERVQLKNLVFKDKNQKAGGNQ